MSLASGAPSIRIAKRLSRLGFADAATAGQLLSAEPLSWWDVGANRPSNDAAAVVVAALGRAPDPDGALRTLAQLLTNAGPIEGAALRTTLETSGQLRIRLIALLGTSIPLGEHLVKHPGDWRVLLGELDMAGMPVRMSEAVGADPADPIVGTAGAPATLTTDAIPALRRAYRRELLAIAARDLAGDLGIQTATEHLADLAGHTLQAALSVAAAFLPPSAATCRLAIIGMGKAGARELNYVSDVDVVFVAAAGDSRSDETAALATATRLAAETMRLCDSVAWQVDATLRPEGKSGPPPGSFKPC
jgi:glutamate-ammonia-ligase adenylyltransferase